MLIKRQQIRKLTILSGIALALFSSSHLLAFWTAFIDNHADILNEALQPKNVDQEVVQKIIKSSYETDLSEENTKNPKPSDHFDAETFNESSEKIKDRLNAAVGDILNCKQDEAMKKLGMVYHAMHDFYSHTNWVENNILNIGGANPTLPSDIPISVSSDEDEDAKGNGDGKTKDDIVIVDNDTIRLRAERRGSGDGRVYMLTYGVRDASRNTIFSTARVEVPHNRGVKGAAVNSDPAYTVDGPGLPPLGVEVIDPEGDNFGTFLGFTNHDITKVTVEKQSETMVLTVEFKEPIQPADAFASNSVGGFIEFDLDQDSSTGTFPSTDFFSPHGTSNLGVEEGIDLFSVSGGFARTLFGFQPVPITFAERSFTLTIPLTLIGGDADLNMAMVVGSFFEPTDVAPNGGHISVNLGNSPNTFTGTGTIEGIVDDLPSIAAHAHITVTALFDPNYTVETQADADGHFRIENIPSRGSIAVEVNRNGETISRNIFLLTEPGKILSGVKLSGMGMPNISWQKQNDE